MATLANVGRNAALDALTALLNSGKIVLHTSAHGVVATLTFGATAFGAASSGSAAANAITADTNAAGGTVAHAHLTKSDDTVIFDVTCGVGSGELQLSSLAVSAGDRVAASSLAIALPAS